MINREYGQDYSEHRDKNIYDISISTDNYDLFKELVAIIEHHLDTYEEDEI